MTEEEKLKRKYIIKKYIRDTLVGSYFSMVTSLFSIFLSIQLYFHPELFLGYAFYSRVGENPSFVTFVTTVFFIVSLLVLIGIFFRNERLEQVALTLLTAAWTGYGLLFLFSPPANTYWLYAGYFITMLLGIVMKEIRPVER